MNKNEQIAALEFELEQKKKLLEQMKKESFNPYGEWEVSTEGDCEGRSTKQLGKHIGNIFDIVKELRSQTYYTLRVKRIRHLSGENAFVPKVKSVSFTIYDDSIKLHDEKDHMEKLQPYIPENHMLKVGNYYGSVKLEWEG